MTKFTDGHSLLKNQYPDDQKLNIRCRLHHMFSTNKYGWANWVFDQLDLRPGYKILELGCGNGKLWAANAHRIPDQCEIILSDFSPGMVVSAQSKLKHISNHFQFEVIDISDIPYRDDKFDLIVANHMLYHIPDRVKAIGEIARVLKPGGVLYASTGGENTFCEVKELLKTFDTSFDTDAMFGGKLGFSLQNGYKQLSAFFGDIEIKRYEDSLRITESKSLVDYILSFRGTGGAIESMSDTKIQSLYAFFDNTIKKDGAIIVTKETGMFIARKN